MAVHYKILGQVVPDGTAVSTLYTVPASKGAVISTISISNRSQGEVKFRIALVPSGEQLSGQHYISYNAPCSGQDSTFITAGFTMEAGDYIVVFAENNQLSFSAFGMEIDQ